VVKKQQKARKRLRAPYMYFFNPCHRCRLARLLDNQFVIGDKDEKSMSLVVTNCRFFGEG
jgi:hypothetical protein